LRRCLWRITAQRSSAVRASIILRMGRLASPKPLLGEQPFSTMLGALGVGRVDIVEIGRWILHPAYRAGGRAAARLAAAAAAFAMRLGMTLGDGSVARHGIVVCSAGTRDRQDLMLRRIGLMNAPDVEPVECERYRDRVQVLYCVNPDTLDPDFACSWIKWRRRSG